MYQILRNVITVLCVFSAIAYGLRAIFFLWDIPSLARQFVQAHEKQARAQMRQARAIEDISEALRDTLFDDDEDGPSDCTRIVTALEKIAGIEPPLTPPQDDPGTTE